MNQNNISVFTILFCKFGYYNIRQTQTCLMNKLIIILSCFCSTVSLGQNGFFLAPEIGAGITGTRTNLYTINPFLIYSVNPTKKIFSYTTGLLLGYGYKNWEISGGAYFLKSGYSERYSAGDFVGYNIKVTESDYHFAVPLILSYKFKFCSHFFLTAGAGAAFSYNCFATVKETDQIAGSNIASTTKKNLLHGSGFDEKYNRTSILGLVQAQIGYKLNDRLSVIAGPEVQYMLTSLLKNTNNYQYNYTYTFNTGIRWNLRKASR